LSENEFTTFILPHLSMPKRGPKCKLGYHRLFNLIPTATLLEHTSLTQGFMGTSKSAFPRRLRPQNRESTWANLGNALKCRCRVILWVLYTGMQWKCLPVPTDTNGKPAIHYTTVYRAFAKWADDGSLWQAFVASVRHLAAEQQLDLSVLHGDGTNTVAKKGAMALGSRGINTRRVTKSSRSLITMAMS